MTEDPEVRGNYRRANMALANRVIAGCNDAHIPVNRRRRLVVWRMDQ